MDITFLGSGNVATHLALAFRGAGHRIVQVWSRDGGHAARLASRVAAQPASDLTQLAAAEAYILAVSDDALPGVADALRLPQALVMHTSGNAPLALLRDVSARCGVLWPVQTLVRTVAMQDYAALPFCIEGATPQVERQIAALARSVSPQVYGMDSAQRQYLHLAAVMVNNFGNALHAMAQELLRAQDIPFETLAPLISATALRAAGGTDLWQQQTGPARRGDAATLARQRQLLQGQPDLLALYEMMTKIIKEKTAGA